MVLAGIIGFFAVMNLGNAMRLWNINFWGVKFQNAEQNVFEQTKSYNHGMIRDLQNMCLALEEAETDTHKSAIRTTMRHRMAAFNGQLPSHVQNCINN